MNYIALFLSAAALLVGFAAGYFVRRYWATKKVGSLEEQLGKKVGEAETKAK